MSILIAEIGSNHFGNMRVAKELIRVAHESGADLIKGQAYRAEDITSGSMPPEFYKASALTEGQCLELIGYARDLKNDMFFSIFSTGFERVRYCQRWVKLSASQTKGGQFSKDMDTSNAVVSFGRELIKQRRVPRVRRASVLYATDYLARDPELQNIDALADQCGEGVTFGLSDHTVGPESCIRAIRWHGAQVIEKHFTLSKNVDCFGTVFRDTVHGALPKELETIAKEFRK